MMPVGIKIKMQILGYLTLFITLGYIVLKILTHSLNLEIKVTRFYGNNIDSFMGLINGTTRNCFAIAMVVQFPICEGITFQQIR